MVFKLHGADENAINESQNIRYEAHKLKLACSFKNILIFNSLCVRAPVHEHRCEFVHTHRPENNPGSLELELEAVVSHLI